MKTRKQTHVIGNIIYQHMRNVSRIYTIRYFGSRYHLTCFETQNYWIVFNTCGGDFVYIWQKKLRFPIRVHISIRALESCLSNHLILHYHWNNPYLLSCHLMLSSFCLHSLDFHFIILLVIFVVWQVIIGCLFLGGKGASFLIDCYVLYYLWII